MIAGVIQARMGSKRLPGKSMLPLGGKPLLQNFIERVQRSRSLDALILATTRRTEDSVLADVAKALGLYVYRGSVDNLMLRLSEAGMTAGATKIVRLCADNPLIEPEEIDRIVDASDGQRDKIMYSNTHNIFANGYPDGIGAEVYTARGLDMLSKEVTDMELLEHPHKWFYGRRRVMTIKCPVEFSDPNLKLDVNTQEEYEYIKGIYNHFGHNDFHITDYIHLISEKMNGKHHLVYN